MVSCIASSSAQTWLDPCFGKGAFLHALASHGINSRTVTAIDLVPDESVNRNLASRFVCADFPEWAAKTDKRFDNIVANPPYVALRRLRGSLRKSALAIKEPDGSAIGLGANYWFVFLCAAVHLLRPGGNICFVLPAAWEYACYAGNFRRHIGERFGRAEIHRCLQPMFEDVQEGSIVLVARQFSNNNDHIVRFRHKSLDRLVAAVRQPKLRAQIALGRRRFPNLSTHSGRCLGDILSIGLGGVTGDVKYFLMNEERRRQLKLPVASMRPVLSKARHLVTSTITRDCWTALRRNGERVWLFDPPPGPRRAKAVKAYLRMSEAKGGCQRKRFKIQARKPWYRTPMPRNVDGFISGMSRFGPWLSFNGMPRLNATNTLYTFTFRNRMRPDEQAAWAIMLLTTECRRALRAVRRVYPDRLIKYEPGDLLRLAIGTPSRVKGARMRYASIVRMMVSGNYLNARRQADKWFNERNKRSRLAEPSLALIETKTASASPLNSCKKAMR
jgi:adenine-specific DNA-methyltransferase